MIPEMFTAGWRFWVTWGVAFLGFPLAGVVATLVVGPASSPIRAGLAGLVGGAVLGLVQWFALQGRVPVPATWIAATAIGLGVGLAVGVSALGSETADSSLLWRAAICGLCVGVLQWLVLRSFLPQSAIWIVALVIAWTAGWFVRRAIGVDLTPKWTIFGSAGALTFQLITGAALYALLSMASHPES